MQSISAAEAVTYRSTKIGLDTIVDVEKYKHTVRKCKIVCTLGPKCNTEDMLGKLLDAGMNVARYITESYHMCTAGPYHTSLSKCLGLRTDASCLCRFNFSHGSHESHLEVLTAFRNATAARSSCAACLLDTKGPEIRTAMLKGGEPIKLVQGQEVIIEAVGDSYTTFEGYSTESETRIGLSYAKLCQSVQPGGKILMADGTISIEVLEIVSGTELKGKVLNSKELGQRKNCNLPGSQPLLMFCFAFHALRDALDGRCCFHTRLHVLMCGGTESQGIVGISIRFDRIKLGRAYRCQGRSSCADAKGH